MSNQTQLLKKTKAEALARPRRIIFDNDGGDTSSLCPGLTAGDLIGVRTMPVLAAGVDTYVYTTGWGFGMGLHDSKVGSVLQSREGHLSNNLAGHFVRTGKDCLRIQSEYVRIQGREFFWGMRMNDTHDQGYAGVFRPDNRFKKEHPDVLFGEQVKYGAVTAVDYLDQRVREFAIAYILDVVDRYDIDGIFLDFFRHPIFFRSNAHGLPASEDEIAAMNSFLRELNTKLNHRRIASGKYYLLAVRVPDSLEYCLAVGLDLETWLSEGLADIMVTAGYFQLNEWEYSARLGHKYGVPVYPSLDESRVKMELARHKRNCLKGFYGRVLNVWDSGSDGICIFNNSGLRDIGANVASGWFAEDSGNYQEALSTVARGREHLGGRGKRHFASFRGVGRAPGGALPHEEFLRTCTLNHHAPLRIASGGSLEIPIRLPEDFSEASKRERKTTVTVNIYVRGNPASALVSLDGKRVYLMASPAPHTEETEAGDYKLVADISPVVLKTGFNIFTVAAAEALMLLDLWVDVNPPSDEHRPSS